MYFFNSVLISDVLSVSICNQENFVVCKDLTNVDILEPVLHFLFISFR